jgi:serine protease Do
VVTMPPPPALTAQLGLKDGFGLLVHEVLPNSPAATAGLQKHDMLTKLNDQQLVESGQFSTLVRGAGKDTEVTLTLLRGGKEQTVTVKVGERMAPPRMPFTEGFDPRRQMENMKAPAQEQLKRIQERMKEFEQKIREYQERLKIWQKDPTSEMPQPPTPPKFDPENAAIHLNPADILVHAQPGGPRRVHLINTAGASSYNTADAKFLIKDENGDIEVSSKDGKRVLVARNAAGETIFDGPIDTEEERKTLPEEIRKKIDQIVVRTNVEPFERPVPAPLAGDGVQ